MSANDLLTTLAQLGVALAGFSGIAVVLGERARGDWSSPERYQLSVLLGASGSVVLWSLVPLLLLSSEIPEPRVWLFSSAGWIVVQVAVLAQRSRQVVGDPSLRVQERGFLIFTLVGGIAALAVQIANLVWLSVAWPHLAAVTWQLVLSFGVFVRLLQPGKV